MMRAVLLAVMVVLSGAVHAASVDGLAEGGRGAVAAIIDGDTVRLMNRDEDVRLVGIQTPKLPLGRKGFKQWPLAEEARTALAEIVKDRNVTLRLGATSKDRNGRILAHLVREDGLWIQEEMLRRGMARVYTFADNRQLADVLYAAENDARTSRRGMWALDTYAVRAAEPAALKRDNGTFQIVAGVVKDAARVGGRVYLNFGDDYRSDFTASIAPEVMGLFKAARIDPLSFKDKTVRVRGYVRTYNGPLIEITHPEQIEIADGPQPQP